MLPEWMIYAGCALASLLIVGGGIKPLTAAYNKLQKYLGVSDYWDDLASVLIGLVLVVVAVGVGGVYGHESEVMGRSWKIGMVWALAGACSTWAMPVVRRRIKDEIKNRDVQS